VSEPTPERVMRIYNEVRKLAHGHEGWDYFYALLVAELKDAEADASRAAYREAAETTDKYAASFKDPLLESVVRGAANFLRARARSLAEPGGNQG